MNIEIVHLKEIDIRTKQYESMNPLKTIFLRAICYKVFFTKSDYYI